MGDHERLFVLIKLLLVGGNLARVLLCVFTVIAGCLLGTARVLAAGDIGLRLALVVAASVRLLLSSLVIALVRRCVAADGGLLSGYGLLVLRY